MADWVVYVKTYDDTDLLKGCVASIPDGIPVYVVDGRYADFPGDGLRTPETREWCFRQEGVHYHTPPDEVLPWGHEHYEDEPTVRWPIHEQARWANYEVLPQDAWVLHLDADERLEHVADGLFDRLDRTWKYAPYIDSLADRDLMVPRIYVPKHWTFWIAGVMYPREYWSRDTPAKRLRDLHIVSMAHQSINRGRIPEAVQIHNVGADRPPDYHERRADQLETMGRHDRAGQYRQTVERRRRDGSSVSGGVK